MARIQNQEGGGGGGGGGGGWGGCLILDRGQVEIRYEPESKKRVLHGNFFQIQMLSEGISYNYFESTPKKTSVFVTLNTRKAKVFNP